MRGRSRTALVTASLLLAAGAQPVASAFTSEGGSLEGRPSPWVTFDDWWPRIGLPLVEPCSAVADRTLAFGDVLVTFALKGNRPVVQATATRQLGPKVERCFVKALGPFARRLLEAVGGGITRVHAMVPVGRRRPLLPPPDLLIPRWSALLGADPGGRRALAAQLGSILPPDVRPGPDACLDITPTPTLAQAAGEWMQHYAERVNVGSLPYVPPGAEEATHLWRLLPDRSYLLVQTLHPRSGPDRQAWTAGPSGRRLVEVTHRICIARAKPNETDNSIHK
jgi:hypothetical protein